MQSKDLMNLECLDFNCLHDSKKLNEITAVDHYAYNHQIHITLE